MPQYTIQVTGVSQRVGQKRDGTGTFTVFEVQDEFGNKWQTFKQQLANEANRLVGQVADIQGRIEQNGKYENRYYDDIRLSTYSNQPPQHEQVQLNPVQIAQQAQQATGNSGSAATQGNVTVSFTPQESVPNPKPPEWKPDGKDWNIMRQTACKVSAQLASNEQEFWVNLDALVTYMATGLMPPEHSLAPTTPQHAQQPSGNQFIPNDPGREIPLENLTDDDIPF